MGSATGGNGLFGRKKLKVNKPGVTLGESPKVTERIIMHSSELPVMEVQA
jgi:hypothetical protein